jgi:dTDP-glucose pyrophosphorylase
MDRINICIPMAGEGSRFKNAGYIDPKPFIPIFDKPMIQWVIKNLSVTNRESNFIFICRNQHELEYDFSKKIKNIFKNIEATYDIITIDKLTEGAACTVLKARNLIDNNEELLIANSDQYMDWNSNDFIKIITNTESDGAILTFHCSNPKWSYAKVDENGWIIQVKEKEVISNYATVGIYYFKHGKDFVCGADEMIQKDIRFNNEFYVCPVYNELIYPMGYKVLNYPIPTQCMNGLGTPEDLEKFKIKYNYLKNI